MRGAGVQRIAIYARVSGEQQVKGTSLDDQTAKCQAEAVQKGYVVVEELREEGVSGAKVDRPSMNRLMKLASQGKIDAVLLAKVDRLARGRLVDAHLELELQKYGVAVLYVGRDTTTKEGRLMVNVEKDFAEWEREVIFERTRNGKLRRALEGKVICPPIRATYGYAHAKGAYTIIPREAKVVRRIFEWYVRESLALHAVAARLNEMGVPTARGAKHWGKNAVYSILNNQAYVGVWRYNRSEAVLPSGKRPVNPNRKTTKSSRRFLPESEWISVPVPAIIEKSLYDEAQERLEFNRLNSRRNTKRQYLLSGLIHCGGCGRFRYTGGTYRTNYTIYQCPGRLKEHHPDPANKCRNRGYQGRTLDALVWNGITDLISQPEGLYRASPAESTEWRARAVEVLAKVASEEARLEKVLDRVMAAYKAGVIEMAELQRERDLVKKELEPLAKGRAEIEARLEEVEVKAVSQERVKRISTALKASLMRESTFEEKRQLLEQLKVKVTVQGDTVMVEGEVGTAMLSYTSQLKPYVRRISLFQADCAGKYPRFTRPHRPKVRGLRLHCVHNQVVEQAVAPKDAAARIPKLPPQPVPHLCPVAHGPSPPSALSSSTLAHSPSESPSPSMSIARRCEWMPAPTSAVSCCTSSVRSEGRTGGHTTLTAYPLCGSATCAAALSPCIA